KEPLRFFAQSPKSNFKFVIGSPEDLDEVKALIYNHSIPPEKVILMPLGTTTEALDEREKWLAELCRDNGFGFSDRMHIRLFGNRRGV
ncbi:MAG: 7-carboxy-7-deazaguanine synthase QueE, partial [Cyclobacteriaceae bacterium]